MKTRLQVVGNVVKRVAKRHMETKKAAVCLSPRFHSETKTFCLVEIEQYPPASNYLQFKEEPTP
jgi:hypothetical protein